MPLILALLLGLTGAAPPSVADATVEAAGADVHDEPDARSFVSGTLRRGAPVRVVQEGPEGWLTIEPPEGSFGWVEASALGDPGRGSSARVVTARAVVRSAHPDARLPGPPWRTLGRGARLRRLDRPPLIVGGRTWVAVAPPAGSVRHIRADALVFARNRPVPAPAPAPAPEPRPTPAPPQEVRAAFAPPDEAPPPEIAEELARIEASHRALLRAPVEDWQLDAIHARYEALLRRVTDSASGNVLRARLDEVERQADIARASRTIETILARSRLRDEALAAFRREIALAERARERPYDAQGMIQPSSRKVDGQRVFALIGPEGTTLAYLDIPPGLDPSPLVARRVGVRGIVHYDEHLRSRLISVRDLDPIDEDPEASRLVEAPERARARAR